MIAWEYFCSLCSTSIAAEQRDAGEPPLEVDCVCAGCEYKMTLQERTEAPAGYMLIRPSLMEGRRYMLAENRKYRHRGFSAVECDMLFAYERRAMDAGKLILMHKEEL